MRSLFRLLLLVMLVGLPISLPGCGPSRISEEDAAKTVDVAPDEGAELTGGVRRR
jgi:hypothetical protein